MNFSEDYQKTLIELDTYYSDSVSDYLAKPIHLYNEILHMDKNRKFIKLNVMSRLCNAILIPTYLTSSIFDLIIALGATLSSICTLGNHLPSLQIYRSTIEHPSFVISRTYLYLLKIINPHAKFNTSHSESTPILTNLIESNDSSRSESILRSFMVANRYGYGPLRSILNILLEDFPDNSIDLDNFFNRHVILRLTIAAEIVPKIITRVIDFAIGFFAANLSILTLGLSSHLNTLAYNSLDITAILYELTETSILLTNPWAFSYETDLIELKE